jgi:DNA-binding MarR family transcriptional regulator
MADGAVHTDGPAHARAGASQLTADAAELGTQIVRFTRLIAALKQRVKYDSGAADRVLLARLVAGGDRRATDLAADAFLDLSTVSRQVRSLVERGLVARYPDPEDRRGTLLTATDAGRAAFQEYRRQRDAQLADLIKGWSSQDRADLIRLMGRLNDHIADTQHAPPSPGGDQEAAVKQGDIQA